MSSSLRVTRASSDAVGLHEHPAGSAGGRRMVGLLILTFLAGTTLIVTGGLAAGGPDQAMIVAGSIANAIGMIGACGVVRIRPGQALVLQRFGRYAGTVRATGLRWIDPLTGRRSISTDTHELRTATLHLTDARGESIRIAALLRWRIEDTALAAANPDHPARILTTHAEAALGSFCARYAYQVHEAGELSLRDACADTRGLTGVLTDSVAPAGIDVLTTTITHLSPAP